MVALRVSLGLRSESGPAGGRLEGGERKGPGDITGPARRPLRLRCWANREASEQPGSPSARPPARRRAAQEGREVAATARPERARLAPGSLALLQPASLWIYRGLPAPECLGPPAPALGGYSWSAPSALGVSGSAWPRSPSGGASAWGASAWQRLMRRGSALDRAGGGQRAPLP